VISEEQISDIGIEIVDWLNLMLAGLPYDDPSFTPLTLSERSAIEKRVLARRRERAAEATLPLWT
jgi:hypothetical protein